MAPRQRLLLLGFIALGCIAAFMTAGANGQWDFVLPFRGIRLATMLLVAYAVAVSTVLFQTITHNRILTPAIMGFDALYVLIQTLVVFSFGMERLAGLSPYVKFTAELSVMVLLACLLFRWLFSGAARSLHLLMLVGVVLGVLLRSLTSFMMRLIDPNEFAMLQDKLFASFNLMQHQLVVVAALIVAAVSLVLWRMLRIFDVLALGRDTAIGLGVDYQRTVMRVLLVVAVLVSVSTALVGPVTFFGLLVANLAWQFMRTERHVLVLPAAVLIGVVFLVGGQLILERVFAFNTALSVVIEFLGGLMFIFLLTRKAIR